MLDRVGSWRSAAPAVRTLLGAASLLGVLGCASARPEAALPPQSLAVERPAAAPALPSDIAPLEPVPPETTGVAAVVAGNAVAAGSATPAPRAVAAAAEGRTSATAGSGLASDPSVVVIDHSDVAGQEDTAALLRDLSRSERERRQAAPAPRLVLNDDNLAAHAEGARVTFSGPASAPPASEAAGDAATQTTASSASESADRDPATDPTDTSEEERYWRSRALDLRQRWRRSYDDVPRLEGDVERLRTAFYAEDDPVRRDRQVKPLWDRALDRLQEARDEVERSREELEVLLAEGKAAGALAGWLREGNELEPPFDPITGDGEPIEEADPDEPVSVEPLTREPPAR